MKPSKDIPRISAPDKETFFKEFVSKSQPVIIKDLVNNWPALKKWNMPYFAENYGTVHTGAIPVKDGECDFNTETGSRLSYTALQESINSIMNGKIENGFAIATPDEVFPSALKNDYPPPEYCTDGKYLRARIFLGAEGTVTSLHQDLFENLYTMVKGTKRITLFAPQDSVYPNPRFSKLPNHAQTNPEKPDYEKFPRFKDAQPYIIDLKASETLYIPSFWWHHLRNVEESIAVSFWWAYGWKLPVVWAAAQYKKLRKI